MSKITLTDITNTQSTSIIAAVNANNDSVETAIENTLSRDGTSPNQMGASLDMNSFSVINLPAPTLASEAVRLDFLQDLVGGLNQETLEEAITAAAETLVARDETEVFRDESESFRDQAASYVGAATSAQRLSTPRNLSYTGEVTGIITGFDGQANKTTSLTITTDAVTNTKLANVATQTIKGRTSASTGDPEDLTPTQVATMLPDLTSATKGLVTRSASPSSTKFLREDGTFQVPPYPSAVIPSAGSYTTSGSVMIGTLMLKWGTYTCLSSAEGYESVYFPVAFPNACVNIQFTTINADFNSANEMDGQVQSLAAANFIIYRQRMSASAGVYYSFYWQALGY